MSHARKPHSPDRRANLARWLWRLVGCLWHLGINRGWRYWQIMRLCERVPAFALQWADALDCEAMSHEANGVTKYAPHLREFAADIRKHHAAYTANVRDEGRA